VTVKFYNKLLLYSSSYKKNYVKPYKSKGYSHKESRINFERTKKKMLAIYLYTYKLHLYRPEQHILVNYNEEKNV
jgi:hypothetical protein